MCPPCAAAAPPPAEHLGRAAAAVQEVLERRPQQLELSLHRSDGAVVDLSVTGIPWVDDDDHVLGIYGIADDVTERNRTARELEVTRPLAVAARQAKSEFVARMSHELRTPLSSILATTELLSETDVDVEQRELLTRLQRSGARLLGLIDGVLDFASAGASKAAATEVFDLHAMVQEVVERVGAAARSKGLQVHLDIADDVPRRIRDHPTWTTQILLNLLTNAVQHTETGFVELAVSTTVSATSGPCLVYRVADSGTGIDPAHHELVFELFAQAPSTGGPRRTGLGLSIVKQLVTISGGTVTLDSALGRGSTFYVVMPAEPVDDDDDDGTVA